MSIKAIFYSALLLGVIYLLFTVGFPVLLAFVIAFLLEPLVQKLCDVIRLKRVLSSLLVCTVFTALFFVLGYFAVSKVAKEAVELISTIASAVHNSGTSWQDMVLKYQNLFNTIPIEYQSSIQQMLNSVSDWLQNLVGSVANLTFVLAKKLPNLLVDVVIFFISLYLFSIRLSSLKPAFLSFFHPDSHADVNLVLNKLSKAIFGFIRAQIIIFILVFLVVYLGFLILGLKYASALAIFVAIIDILPILGTGSVLIPMAIYMYFSGNLFLCVGLLIHYVVIIAFRKVIEAKVLADNVGIGALSALISMYLGFQLAGLVGLFMGPITILLFQTLVKVGIIKIKINF